MKERSLNRKLWGAFGLMAIIILMGGAIGVTGLIVLESTFQKMTKTHYAAMSDLASLQDHIFSLRKTAALTLQPEVFGDDVRRRGYVRELGVLMARVDEGMRRYEGYVGGGDASRLWGDVKGAWGSG